MQCRACRANGYGSKLNHQETAGFSLWFHLPGFPKRLPIFDPQPNASCLPKGHTKPASTSSTASPSSTEKVKRLPSWQRGSSHQKRKNKNNKVCRLGFELGRSLPTGDWISTGQEDPRCEAILLHKHVWRWQGCLVLPKGAFSGTRAAQGGRGVPKT